MSWHEFNLLLSVAFGINVYFSYFFHRMTAAMTTCWWCTQNNICRGAMNGWMGWLSQRCDWVTTVWWLPIAVYFSSSTHHHQLRQFQAAQTNTPEAWSHCIRDIFNRLGVSICIGVHKFTCKQIMISTNNQLYHKNNNLRRCGFVRPWSWYVRCSSAQTCGYAHFSTHINNLIRRTVRRRMYGNVVLWNYSYTISTYTFIFKYKY